MTRRETAKPEPAGPELAVICTPGFELITRSEIESLGLAVAGVQPGLIECSGGPADVYRLNFQLRTASRVLVRLGEFNAAAFSELHKKAARLPWKKFLTPGVKVQVRVATHASALYHKKGIAERVIKAIVEAIGGEVIPASATGEDVEAGVQLVMVRLVRNMCAISIDSSGEHLHRRGYRLETGKAPLRETLAASLVFASAWNLQSPLVDPFCGSGTILIEAAMLAGGLAPGRNRSFSFQAWPGFDDSVWRKITQVQTAPVHLPHLFGTDRDEGVIRSAKANAARAGVAHLISFSRKSISDMSLPPAPGWIVTNPPYGGRIKGGHDLRDLYARTGRVFRERAAGWRMFMISASPRWTGQMGMATRTVARFDNGGLPVSLMELSRQDEGLAIRNAAEQRL